MSLLALAACASPPDRGYYRPAGLAPSLELASCSERTARAHVESRVQGVYVDEVDGKPRQTVHVQLSVTRPRSGDLRLTRDSLAVQFREGHPSGAASVMLAVSQVWRGRELLEGDLVVPAWGRRSFDLFFDRPVPEDGLAPARVLLLWSGADESGGDPVAGQCLFVRIEAADPFHPAPGTPGYYLPGPPALGSRRLREDDQERLHPLFHDPTGWWP